MSMIELSAQTRTESGKGPARQMRRDGRVPAVIYGMGLSPVNISLDTEEFKEFLSTKNYSTSLIKLKVEGLDDLASKVFMIQELQLHHIQREPMAVDFKSIDLTKPVTVTVALKFDGMAKGVKKGGILQPLAREILITCLPTDIPSSIHCNISELGEGQTWYAEHLSLPEALALKSPADTPIVTCIKQRKDDEAKAEGGAEGEGADDGDSEKKESGGE